MSEVMYQTQTDVPALLTMPFHLSVHWSLVLSAALASLLIYSEMRRRHRERFLTAIAIYQHRHHDAHSSQADRPAEGAPHSHRR